MLIVNKNIRSLPSEGWMCNFEVVWLYHLLCRNRVHWTRRWAIWSSWVSEQTRLQMSTHLNVSYESECHRCWPDICRGPWEGGFWGASSNRRLPYLLSFVTWANCEPRLTMSRTMHLSVFGPGTDLFTQVPIQHRASKDSHGEYPALISFSLDFHGHNSVTADTETVTPSGVWSVVLLSTLSMIDGTLFFRSVPSHD